VVQLYKALGGGWQAEPAKIAASAEPAEAQAASKR
jgi:hypothetical protein